MTEHKHTVIVAGDVSVDSVRFDGEDSSEKSHKAVSKQTETTSWLATTAMPGGAWLIAQLMYQALGLSEIDVSDQTNRTKYYIFAPFWTVDTVQNQAHGESGARYAYGDNKDAWTGFKRRHDSPVIRGYNPYGRDIIETPKRDSDDLSSLHVEIEKFQRSLANKKSSTYRVKKFDGLKPFKHLTTDPDNLIIERGLDDCVENIRNEKPSETKTCQIIINYAGDTFPYRSAKEILSICDNLSSKQKKNIHVIIKAHPDLFNKPDDISNNDECKELKKDKEAFRATFEKVAEELQNQLIIILNAQDIRERRGMISRGSSWDRTISDTVEALEEGKLNAFSKYHNVLIRFDLDGVLHYSRKNDDRHVTMYYDPNIAEGEFRRHFDGEMLGFGSVFTASLALNIDGFTVDALEQPIRRAIVASRRLLERGYKIDPEHVIEVDHYLVFERNDQLIRQIAKSEVPSNYARLGQEWSILYDIAGKGAKLDNLVEKIVREGKIPPDEQGVPIARFGNLETLDREEIEGYRAAQSLFKDYLDKDNVSTPLSVAVFGQPGSGKSFGVKQIASELKNKGIKKPLEFNVAQFETVKDIASALQMVRDETIAGNVPLVFFDEFDAKLGETDLGWLKYFLAPMQDGEFRDGASTHAIGKAIFIFAGGTKHSFIEFSDYFKDALLKDKAVQELERGAKLPDFISRLRGYVNVAGPNSKGGERRVFTVRRAVLLRSLLKRSRPNLIKDGQLQIDDGVLNAFLNIKKYKHGVRSMEAIIDMSALATESRFDPWSLPTAEQMNMHVDAREFMDYVKGRIKQN